MFWTRLMPPPGGPPYLVGWDDGSWAVGERLWPVPAWATRSKGWVQQGTSTAFDKPPTWFMTVAAPPA